MWQADSNLIQYLPYWFREILDYQEICKTETAKYEALAREINGVADNYFFQTMDINAVKQWEQIFNIIPDPSFETLEFRRIRVLNRISTRPPFTLGFLYQKLDELIGKDKWKVTVDYPNYTLYIESSAENQQYATEISYTINRIKPAHIVFISKPYVSTGIVLNEEVALAELMWRYRLGTWGIGINPFATTETKEVLVMSSQYSIENEMLSDTAAAIAANIASARINGSIVIEDISKSSQGNTATILYTVTSDMVSAVTKIELLDVDGNVLTSSPVYVPITEPAIFTHNIPVEEAAS